MIMDELQFEPLYPDVLSAITGGLRIGMDTLHMAIGVHPRSVYLNQPVEIVIVLQNMIDQPMDIKIGVQLPTRDDNGKAIHMMTPKKVIDVQLKPGEVGTARLPIVPMPPTMPNTDIPIRVAVRRRARGGTMVRSAIGGAPPSALTISTYKLQALREVDFVEHPYNVSPEIVTVTFDVAAKRLPSVPPDLKPTYESLWTREQMSDERQNIRAKLSDARMVADELSHAALYLPMLHMVDEVYAQRGLPLYPGEAKAIAKCLVFTLDSGMAFDQTFKLEDARWFQTLAQALAYDEGIAKLEAPSLAARYLFEAGLYDAVLVGFGQIRPRVRINLGDKTERIAYANKLLGWLAGLSEPDLSYIYLPLALGGVVVNHLVGGKNDDPWQMLEELRDAYRARIKLVSGEIVTVFDMLDKLLTRNEEELRRARILPKG
jgi:hypothetical protein